MPLAAADEATLNALAKVEKVFKADLALMDEVLAFVQGLLTRGSLQITKPRGLNQGVLMIAAGILAKCCKTVRALRAAATVGCGQDASILLRALFESTVALLWILQRDSQRRAILFAAHEDQRWLVIVEEHRKTRGLIRVYGKQALTTAKANVDRWRALLKPRWTAENRQLIDTSKPTINRAAETGEFYFAAASVRKSVWSFVRQLRGPHLRTCA